MSEKVPADDRLSARIVRAEVTSEPISVSELADAVGDRAAGAVLTFDGVVRDHDGGRGVIGLTYSSHPSADEIVRTIAEEVAALRARGQPTVPTTIGREKAANPFLRADAPALMARWGDGSGDPVQTFAALRAALLAGKPDDLPLRLVDVDRALAARRYPAPIDLVLEVRDAFCPWNDGRWHVWGHPAGAYSDRTDRDPDVMAGVLMTVSVGIGALLATPLARGLAGGRPSLAAAALAGPQSRAGVAEERRGGAAASA